MSYNRVWPLLLSTLWLQSGCDWRLPTPKPRSVTALVVVLDQSTSTQVESRCAELSARLASIGPSLRTVDLLVLGTGDVTRTSGEPIAFVPWRRLTNETRLYEAPSRVAKRRQAELLDIEQLCEKALHPLDTSPIYRALYRASAALDAHCAECAAAHERCDRRMVAVHSDMVENAEEAIVRRIKVVGRNLKGGRRPSRAPADLPRLKAEVDWQICGVADHARSPGEVVIPPGVLESVWRDALGVETLVFGACPGVKQVSAPQPSGGAR